MSEYSDKKHYDITAGQMITVAQSMKLEHDRVLYDVNEWHRVHDAPPPGIGLDGYPLQRGKELRVESGELR